MIEKHTFWNISRRVLLYVALALAGLVGIGLLVATAIYTGIAFIGGWVGLIGYTLVLFWIIVSRWREYWNRTMFWLIIASLLTLHLLGFVAVLRIYPQWRMIWFLPIIVLEAALFSFILDTLLGDRKRNAGGERF